MRKPPGGQPSCARGARRRCRGARSWRHAARPAIGRPQIARMDARGTFV